MTDKTFTCAACGETFECAWTDEEAEVEAAERFGSHPDAWREGAAVICDDCYQKMVKKNN